MDRGQSKEKIRQQIEKTVSDVNILNEEDTQVLFVTREEELDNLDIEGDDFIIYLSIKMNLNDVKTTKIIEPRVCNMKKPFVNLKDCSTSQRLVKQNTFSPEKKRTIISKKSIITNGTKIEKKTNTFEDSDSLSGSSTDTDDLELDFSSLR